MERVAILMPKLGLTTGEMPHLRDPPKNYMPGQMLYYLYTACRNLGCETTVVDVNWSLNPLGEVLEFRPDKILISTATPSFEGTLAAISGLRALGYDGPIYVGGPHVSLNRGQRDWLLPARDGVTYIETVHSRSTFEWVPRVFPGRSPLEVLGLPEAEARRFLADSWRRDTGKAPSDGRLDSYLFSYFAPSFEWMQQTYSSARARPQMRAVPIRHSLITSIGCSKTCSFCGNPYIYRLGFKHKEVVRGLLRDFKARGVDRVSVADMFFTMSMPHTNEMMQVFKEEGIAYSMQTCLENLTDALFLELKQSGLTKCLVGIENPVSYSVGKTVELAKLRWLLDKAKEVAVEGVKLSYVVGLPGVTLEEDLALLDHVLAEVVSRRHPLHDLQVNLYTPYRPESDTQYVPYGEAHPPQDVVRARLPASQLLRIQLLDKIPYSYWGSFPTGIASEEDFWRQLVLCDLIYDLVYAEFRDAYLEARACYLDRVLSAYPALASHVPTLDDSRAVYGRAVRARTKLERAVGNDRGRGRRPLLMVSEK